MAAKHTILFEQITKDISLLAVQPPNEEGEQQLERGDVDHRRSLYHGLEVLPSPVDPVMGHYGVERAARNLAKYLGDLLTTMARLVKEAEPLRNRILADIKSLVDALPERDRGAVLSAIAVETQKVFNAAGSPKVGVSGGCVGAGGVGVTATEGNVTVKGCVIGTFASGPQGGGAEVTVKY